MPTFTTPVPTSRHGRSPLALAFAAHREAAHGAPPGGECPANGAELTYYFLDAPFPPVLLPLSQLTITAIVQKYMETQWHYDMASLTWNAVNEACAPASK
jgi:hypothetical protein